MRLVGFQPGDMIQRPGPFGTTHVGIYIGSNGWNGFVIHNDKDTGIVRQDDLQTFEAGHQATLLRRTARSWYEQQVIVNRAHSLLGQKFDLVNFNCEHLATYAQGGIAQSPQLRIAGILSLVCLFLLLVSAHESA